MTVQQNGGADNLRERIEAIQWYHTLELAPGITTPGWIDHRPILDQVPMPRSLNGARCLDVGTFNGFWAFEMERRGAGEVVAVDVLDPRRWDWPHDSEQATIETLAARSAHGRGFDLAKEVLGSQVRHVDSSVYDLSEGELGRFDFVYLGSLLIHLRDPVRALERIRAVCDGTLLVVDGIDLPLTWRHRRVPAARLDGRGRPWWWYPNLAGLSRLVESAGFQLLAPARRLFLPPGEGWPVSRWRPGGLRNHEGRYQLTVAWRGDPHGVVLAQPV